MKTKQLIIIILIFTLAACAPQRPDTPPAPLQPDPTEEPIIGINPPNNSAPVYFNHIDVLIMESYPVQVSVTITGDLPTPCHTLNVVVAEANANNEIHIQVDSTPSDEMCIQVLEPFETAVPLSLTDLADGDYTVWVNGELVGEFGYPG